jgi:hypothetical protein
MTSRAMRHQQGDLLPLRRQAALYRAVLADGLSRMGAAVDAIASANDAPATKLDRFIDVRAHDGDAARMPALMLAKSPKARAPDVATMGTCAW